MQAENDDNFEIALQPDGAVDQRVARAFPILRSIKWDRPQITDDYWINVLGAHSSRSYSPPKWADGSMGITADEEAFEWVTLVETIKMAGQRFVMADLGAGFGRWLVNGFLLARRLHRDAFVIGVEAEDTHYKWMHEHLSTNGVARNQSQLFHAPIAGTCRKVPFTIGHPYEWYGQAVLENANAAFGDWPNAAVEIRETVTLDQIIKPVDTVDLLDLDIQGMELEVLSSSIDLITRHIRRIYVSTHSRDIENSLRTIMAAAGWRSVLDFPCLTKMHPTPIGPIDFVDGVQSWLNPFLQPSTCC